MRVHQWVKNSFVAVPFVFSREIFSLHSLRSLALAFFAFSFVASGIYLFNDWRDREADRLHPKKKYRPIASGKLSARMALQSMVVLWLIGFGLGLLLPLGFIYSLLSYIGLNLAYSTYLKRLAYLDVICIALGFELRVIAGSAAAQVTPSAYLLAVTFVLALFLGFGKRYHELSFFTDASIHRPSLGSYRSHFLDWLLMLTGLGAVALYVIYTLDPATQHYFATDKLAYTIPFAAFGVFRFVQLAKRSASTESPTESMLRDPSFMLNLGLWAVCIVWLVYPR